MIKQLAEPSYVAAHMYWRYCFLRAVNMPPPQKSIYYNTWDDVVLKRGIFSKIKEPLFDAKEVTQINSRPGRSEASVFMNKETKNSKKKKK